MNVDWNDTISGQPIMRVRDFLRHARRHDHDDAFPADLAADFFAVSSATAETITRELLARKLIRPANKSSWYYVADAGRRLSAASAKRRIPRAKADKIFAAFLERAAEVNRRPELSHTVREVLLFGSYLDGNDEVGDIDLVVDLERRQVPGSWTDYNIARAHAAGRHRLQYLQKLFYGETEIKQLLKARSPYLSFHDMDSLKELGVPSKIVFPLASD